MRKNIIIILLTLIIYNTIIAGFLFFFGNPFDSKYVQLKVKDILRSSYFGEFKTEQVTYNFMQKTYMIEASNGIYKKSVLVSMREKDGNGMPKVISIE